MSRRCSGPATSPWAHHAAMTTDPRSPRHRRPRHRRRARHRPAAGPCASPGTAPPSALVARSGDELAETRELIESAGGIAAAARADVTDADALARRVRHAARQLGPVDVLVNNAGVARADRPAVGGRRRRVVDDDGRQRARHRARQPSRAARDGRRRAGPDHQHHQPGRRPPLAARLRLLGVQGGGRQAHREPRPGGQAPRRERVQRPPGAAADRHGRRRSPPHRPTSAHEALVQRLDGRRDRRRPRRRPRAGHRPARARWPPATPTASAAATSRSTTTSTRCCATSPRCTPTTSTSCGPSACRSPADRDPSTTNHPPPEGSARVTAPPPRPVHAPLVPRPSGRGVASGPASPRRDRRQPPCRGARS